MAAGNAWSYENDPGWSICPIFPGKRMMEQRIRYEIQRKLREEQEKIERELKERQDKEAKAFKKLF